MDPSIEGKTTKQAPEMTSKLTESSPLGKGVYKKTTSSGCEDCETNYTCPSHSLLKKYITFYNTGEIRFHCQFCEKIFKHKYDLQKHVRIHTGEKPFKCQHCSRRFSQKQSLKCHIRMHTGEKPYECGLCDEKFRLLSGLKRHVTKHTDEKS